MRIEFENIEFVSIYSNLIEIFKLSESQYLFIFFLNLKIQETFYLFVTSYQVNNNYQILDRQREENYLI